MAASARRWFLSSVCALLFLFVAAPAHAQGSRFLRDPDVGPTDIVFVHANDLWLVPRAGGDARRLTSADGAETEPAFSPDGRWIAFTGQYAGNTDVYVVSASGGEPRRLTWHPAGDVVQGWTPDGLILFQSSREGRPTRRAASRGPWRSRRRTRAR
jgi:tricorn protease